jgi:hypothetical protein
MASNLYHQEKHTIFLFCIHFNFQSHRVGLFGMAPVDDMALLDAIGPSFALLASASASFSGASSLIEYKYQHFLFLKSQNTYIYDV